MHRRLVYTITKGLFLVLLTTRVRLPATSENGVRSYLSFTKTRSDAPIDFQDPFANHVEGGGTVALKINSAGRITGYYVDTGGYPHGFVRDVLPAPNN